MNALLIVIGSITILVCIGIVILVLLQQGQSNGLSGAIAGGSESFLGKNKSRSMESRLSRLTKILGIVFAVLAVVMLVLLTVLGKIG